MRIKKPFKKKMNSVKSIFRILTSLAIILWLLSSCQEKIEYPIEPEIAFQDYLYLLNSDSTIDRGLLILSFTDGDGDIGLVDDVDTIPPYDFNLFIDYYEFREGEWKQLVDPSSGDTINFNGRIPMLTPAGKNKNISGTIEDTLFLNLFSDYDSFRYEVYIKDRALHESNRIVTPILLKP